MGEGNDLLDQAKKVEDGAKDADDQAKKADKKRKDAQDSGGPKAGDTDE